jgi:hypothetical protein
MKITNKLLVIVLIIIVLGSCTRVGNEIVGAWDFQSFSSTIEGDITWKFYPDGKLIRVYMEIDQETGDQFIIADTATYSVNQSLTKKMVVITGGSNIPGSPSPEGTLRVDKLKNDILIMTRTQLPKGKTEDIYLRCEMIRKI